MFNLGDDVCAVFARTPGVNRRKKNSAGFARNTIKSLSRRPVAKVLLSRAERRCCVSAQRASSSDSLAQRAKLLERMALCAGNAGEWSSEIFSEIQHYQRLLNRAKRSIAV